MEFEKYYALYSNENQTKLLSFASSLDEVNKETEYHSDGVWFEYDKKVGSNLLQNEKKISIEFPKEPKARVVSDYIADERVKIKARWLS